VGPAFKFGSVNCIFSPPFLFMATVSAPIPIPLVRGKEPEVSQEAGFGFPASPSPPDSWSARLRQRAERWAEKRACTSAQKKSAKGGP